MRRLLIAAVLCLSAACGGSDGGGSPTAPSGGQSTKRIFLEGDLNFGDVQVGSTHDRNLRIYNQGSAPITVTGLTGPSGYTASWTSGTVPPNNGFQEIRIRFTPTEERSYSGTLTVSADHTSGTNTIPISGRGAREPFTRSGVGNTVFDMPTGNGLRMKITGDYTGNSENFVVYIGGRLVVNELVGTHWNQTHHEGIYLTNGGVVEIKLSSGVRWSLQEQR